MEDERVTILKTLGLAEPQARLYAVLAAQGRATAREASERAGVPRTRVYSVLKGLVEAGLVHSDGDHYAARPLAPLVEARSESAARRRNALKARRDVLAREYQPLEAAPAEGDVRLVRGGARPSEILVDLLDGARERLDASFSAATLAHALAEPGTGEALRRAVERLPSARIVVSATAADVARLAALPPAILCVARVAPREWWHFDRVVADERRVLLRFTLAAERELAGAAPDLALTSQSGALAADAVAAVALAWRHGRLALAFLADARAESRPRPGSRGGGALP